MTMLAHDAPGAGWPLPGWLRGPYLPSQARNVARDGHGSRLGPGYQ